MKVLDFTINKMLALEIDSLSYLKGQGFFSQDIVTFREGTRTMYNIGEFLNLAYLTILNFNQENLKKFNEFKLEYVCENGTMKLFLIHPNYLSKKHPLKDLTQAYLEFFEWRLLMDIQAYWIEKDIDPKTLPIVSESGLESIHKSLETIISSFLYHNYDIEIKDYNEVYIHERINSTQLVLPQAITGEILEVQPTVVDNLPNSLDDVFK